MRSSKSRSRSKSNRPRTMGNIINRVFDSSGPDGKVRGTPQQIIEKYLVLARDAQLSNDRVAAENFLQHAEHYTRMLGEAQRELAAEQEARQQYQYRDQRDYRPDDRDGTPSEQPYVRPDVIYNSDESAVENAEAKQRRETEAGKSRPQQRDYRYSERRTPYGIKRYYNDHQSGPDTASKAPVFMEPASPLPVFEAEKPVFSAPKVDAPSVPEIVADSAGQKPKRAYVKRTAKPPEMKLLPDDDAAAS